MINDEFSVEFDILYNNISSDQAPGLSEYEKSVFLTQAQEAFVLDTYTGTTWSGFEGDELVSSLLRNVFVEKIIPVGFIFPGSNTTEDLSIDDEAYWFRVFEEAVIADKSLKCEGRSSRTVDVYPVSNDTLSRTRRSPFRGANERRVLRVDVGQDKFRLISKYPIMSYTVRYIRRPDPIILEDLEEGLSINGVSTKSSTNLDSQAHRQILVKAVEMAKAAWKS